MREFDVITVSGHFLSCSFITRKVNTRKKRSEKYEEITRKEGKNIGIEGGYMIMNLVIIKISLINYIIMTLKLSRTFAVTI